MTQTKTRNQRRRFLRMATYARDQLLGETQTLAWDAGFPGSAMQNFEAAHRQLQMAMQRDFSSIAPSLRLDYERSCRQLREALTRSLEYSQRYREQVHRARVRMASVEDVYRDLLALEKEFSGITLTFNKEEKAIAVVTEDISFEGVDLGPFQIKLHWPRWSSGAACYDIHSLEPNRSSQGYEHPHISQGTLCEGAGASAIAEALNSARLYDFFQLLASVVRTYNESGPYQKICEWYEGGDESSRCDDCGESLPADEAGVCRGCGDTLCASCEYSCSNDHCDEYRCVDCVKTCQGCDEKFCASCMSTEDKTLCEECYDESKKEQEAESAEDEPSDEDEPEVDDDSGGLLAGAIDGLPPRPELSQGEPEAPRAAVQP